MPNDLNIQLSQRVSVALVFILVGLSGFTALKWGGYFLAPLFAILFVLLARWWAEFSEPDRPKAALVVLLAVMASIVYLSYSYRMYGLIPPLMLTPALLLMRHRYAYGGMGNKLLRGLGLIYIACSIAIAIHYLPPNGVVFISFIILAVLGLMNSSFYLFLAGKRGVLFMLATIPFHLLYHFYNGISFLMGLFLHLQRRPAMRGEVSRQTEVASYEIKREREPVGYKK
jgi:hypothetical protein